VEVALHDNVTNSFIDGEGCGEIYVKGPNVFSRYWNDPEATEATFDEGWLRTGDVAERDDGGYYRICGRSKEMFISGGENVYPAEVEQVLAAYVDVDDAAIVAVAHPRWGETGIAFVVSKRDSNLDLVKLAEHCRSSLAAYKVPSQFRVIRELPRTPVGKIDKICLTRLAQSDS
jgi:fatty-acyl-CoA synthase